MIFWQLIDDDNDNGDKRSFLKSKLSLAPESAFSFHISLTAAVAHDIRTKPNNPVTNFCKLIKELWFTYIFISLTLKMY